jgi:hypothetical protein
MQEATRPRRSMLEKELHKNVHRELTRRKIWFVDSRMDKPTTQRKGVPDFICCVHGRVLAIELKRPGEGLTPEQIREFDGIKASGGVAIRATCLEDVLDAILAIVAGYQK